MKRFILLFALLLTFGAQAATVEMKVDGLVCAFCAQADPCETTGRTCGEGRWRTHRRTPRDSGFKGL